MKNLSLKLQNHLQDNNNIIPNDCQINASNLIEKLLSRSNRINLFYFSKDVKFGIYILGSVGVGKSVLLKALSYIYPFSEILHFSDLIFILQAKNQQNKNFLQKIKKKKVILIDELYINNFTSLILFKKFVDQIKKIKIPIIMSGNKKLSKIYADKVNPKLCEELINDLENNFLTVNIKSKIDYRSKKKINQKFFLLKDSNSISKQNLLIKKFAECSSPHEGIFKRKGNQFNLKKFYGNLIEIDFFDFFSKNLIFQDYELIAKKVKIFVLRNTEQMNEDSKNFLTRFISFIDVLYENKNILSIATNIELEKLYIGKTNYKEFQRTLSRLKEMGSTTYIKKNL